MLMSRYTLGAVVSAAAMLGANGALANVLANPAFNVVGPAGPTTTQTLAAAGPGQSAAANWTTWLNSAGTIDTALKPSTLVPGGRMIDVKTSVPGAGLVQVFLPFNTGPKKAYACTWIYVVRGQVGIGIGNGGNTGLDALVGQTGAWERLEVSNGRVPANEFIIYAASPGGAEFYVESAEVDPDRRIPCACAPK